jgi:hypothetical protein
MIQLQSILRVLNQISIIFPDPRLKAYESPECEENGTLAKTKKIKYFCSYEGMHGTGTMQLSGSPFQNFEHNDQIHILGSSRVSDKFKKFLKQICSNI